MLEHWLQMRNDTAYIWVAYFIVIAISMVFGFLTLHRLRQILKIFKGISSNPNFEIETSHDTFEERSLC